MIKEKLEQDKVLAMKSRKDLIGSDLEYATLKLNVIRSLLAAITAAETSGKVRKELSEEELISVLRKASKQRRESAEIYNNSNAADRAKIENSEADVIDSYVPQVLNEEDTKELVLKTINELGLSGIQSVGQLMGIFKNRTDLDKALVSRVARELL